MATAYIEKAVAEMQLYLGSVDYADVRTQARLHKRVMRTVQKIAEKRGMGAADVWEQLSKEALVRGVIRPLPGKHY
jgi:hypothetical protein